MKEKKEKVFRTFNQYIRPKIPQNVGSKYYRGNNKPIDVCRYHDTYDRGLGILTEDRKKLFLERDYTVKKDGFSVVRRKCSNPYCRFCPHIRQFRLADGKLYTAPTAEDFRRTLPDGPRGRDSYLKMKHRVERIIEQEKRVSWLIKFEKKMMTELDTIIEHLGQQMREVDTELLPYDAFHFRWAPLPNLPEQEIVGPYTPLWGARLDLALVLLRGAYEEVRRNLYGFYHGRRGPHSVKWSGLLLPATARRTEADVPRYPWRFLLFSKVMGTLTYKTYLTVGGGAGGVSVKRKLQGKYPIQADLAPWFYLGVRSNILASSYRTRTLDQLGDVLATLLREAKTNLPILAKQKNTRSEKCMLNRNR